MTLNTKQKQDLKGKAHKLKPVILIGGKGLTPAVLKEVDGALNHHELIKIRVASSDRDERRAILIEIAASTQSELIQTIGNIGVFYRKTAE